jgi:RNA polymerase sigma-70 factor (ECF subfamily)
VGSDHSEWVLEAVRCFEGPLLVYVSRLLGDSERARDVVQEAFLSLCRQDRRKVEGRLAAWLFTVCRNRVRDHQRKENRMTVANQAALDARPSPLPDPAETVERADANGRMLASLSALPERTQEVLRLKFQNGFSYREISDVTGLTVSNVGFILHTGLQKLRELVEAPRAGQVPPKA